MGEVRSAYPYLMPLACAKLSVVPSRYFADTMRETYRRSGLGKVVGLLADAGIEPESTVYDILKQVFVNATMMVFTETIGHVQVHALSSPM